MGVLRECKVLEQDMKTRKKKTKLEPCHRELCFQGHPA